MINESKCYFKPHDPRYSLPDVDEIGQSDLVVVFTTDGQCETASYNTNTKLWYSSTDPTGFGNVIAWSPFTMPDDFVLDEKVYYGGIAEEGDSE